MPLAKPQARDRPERRGERGRIGGTSSTHGPLQVADDAVVGPGPVNPGRTNPERTGVV